VRLKDSPACLVRGEADLSAQLRRVLAASGQELPATAPTFEINIEHPLVRYLDTLSDAEQFKELALVLFDQTCLVDEGQVAAPAEFSRRLNGLLVRLAGVQ
jgi:molecular chaperone HtpG